MPLSSKQATSAVYQTFLSARAGAGAPFGTPVLVSELAFADRSTVDGFLTDDGLTLFYSSQPLQFPLDDGPPSDGGIVHAVRGPVRGVAAIDERAVFAHADARRPRTRAATSAIPG